jgi:hypothetical protein
MSSCTYIQCFERETIKPKLFDLSLIDRAIFERPTLQYELPWTSNMLSNVFKCFMLISLPKKHERLILPEIKNSLIIHEENTKEMNV